MKINQLYDGMKRIECQGRIVEKEDSREVKSRFRDETYKVANAVLADDSGKVKITLWEEHIERVNVGDNVTVTNGYITSFKGEIQLNVGKFGVLTIS